MQNLVPPSLKPNPKPHDVQRCMPIQTHDVHAPAAAAPQAREVADTAVGLLKAHNRRTLDVIAARIYFYYSWAYECLNRLADVRR
jgi:hypothetical protein